MRCVMLITGAMVLVAAVGQAARGADESDEAKIRGTWQLVIQDAKGSRDEDRRPKRRPTAGLHVRGAIVEGQGRAERSAGRKDGHLFSRSQANAQAARPHDSKATPP